MCVCALVFTDQRTLGQKTTNGSESFKVILLKDSHKHHVFIRLSADVVKCAPVCGFFLCRNYGGVYVGFPTDIGNIPQVQVGSLRGNTHIHTHILTLTLHTIDLYHGDLKFVLI